MALGYQELVKREETSPGQPKTGPENGVGNGGADTGDGHISEEPQDLSPTRFKTKEFRLRPGEVDNPHLA